MTEPLLSVRNLETYYGPITAIRGVSFDVSEGQIVTILGANGAGKTTVLRSVCGALEPQKGTRRLRRPPHQGARAGLGGAQRHRPRARGARDLPVHDGQGQPHDGRLRAPRPRRHRARHRDGLRLLPRAARARRPGRRLSLRRPAADAGDRPRADGAAQAHAARRAVARPLADPHQGNLRHHPPPQCGAGRDHAAGRAERQHGAQDRALRLRAGDRPHRAGGRLRQARRRTRTCASSTSARRKPPCAARSAGSAPSAGARAGSGWP